VIHRSKVDQLGAVATAVALALDLANTDDAADGARPSRLTMPWCPPSCCGFGARRRARRSAPVSKRSQMRVRCRLLSEEESHGFYERFSNGVLWPLLHVSDRLPFDVDKDYQIIGASISALPKRSGQCRWPITTGARATRRRAATSSTTTSRSTKPPGAVRKRLAHRRRCAQSSGSPSVDTVIERPCPAALCFAYGSIIPATRVRV